LDLAIASVRSLVSAKRSATGRPDRWDQTEKRLHFLAYLWSQSEFTTQWNAERKTNPKKWKFKWPTVVQIRFIQYASRHSVHIDVRRGNKQALTVLLSTT